MGITKYDILVFLFCSFWILVFVNRENETPKLKPKYLRQFWGNTPKLGDGYSNKTMNTVSSEQRTEGRYNAPCSWKVQFWGGPRLMLKDGDYMCPDNCTVQFTSKRGYDVMNASHVVILHHTANWNLDKIVRARTTNQILAYWTREAQMHSRKTKNLTPFNWTISYQSTADIPIPYGTLRRLTEKEAVDVQTKNWAEGKTKLAIWIASNCGGTTWPRTKFVRSLSKLMEVDMFGGCGARCGTREECFKRIYSYKFYLSLENSQCDDYVTEKMWRNAFKYDAVPIVYGTSKSNYQELAPKNSFIHAGDFQNLSSLVSYIKRIDQNDTEYNKFFEWRREFYVDQPNEAEAFTVDKLCSISKKLLNIKTLHTFTSDKSHWFKNTCHSFPLPDMV